MSSEIVCACLDITDDMIREAVESGAKTLEEVQEITNVGSVCGICLDDIQQLIDEYANKED